MSDSVTAPAAQIRYIDGTVKDLTTRPQKVITQGDWLTVVEESGKEHVLNRDVFREMIVEPPISGSR